jgi:hypothetical protein
VLKAKGLTIFDIIYVPREREMFKPILPVIFMTRRALK